MKKSSDIKKVIHMTLFILICLIILPTVIFSNRSYSRYKLNPNNIINQSSISYPKDGKVSVYRRDKGIIENIPLEEYITGVVSAEMPAEFNSEAIKAQAVAARTYYMNKMQSGESSKYNGAEISDGTDCQVYQNKEEALKKWSSSKGEEYWNKIKKCVLDTEGEVLTYNGELINYPQYFAVSSGRTEDSSEVLSKDIPYLKSVDSIGDEYAPKYKSEKTYTLKEFINMLKKIYPNIIVSEKNLNRIIIMDRYGNSGSVNQVKIGNKSIKGEEFRKIFSLNSNNFTITQKNDIVSIACTGYGHNIGMSQWGANYMAKNGYSYDKILKHYYSNVDIKNIEYK